MDATLDDASLYDATVSSVVYTFDDMTSQTVTTGLTINDAKAYQVYNLKFRVYTSPVEYDFILGIVPIQVNGSKNLILMHNIIIEIVSHQNF